MEIKVAVFKIREIGPTGMPPADNNPDIPTAFKGKSYVKIYLSKDLLLNEKIKALKAVKEILNNTSECEFIVWPDGPLVDLDNSKKFSEELSAKAVELLSNALPQYQFSVSEHAIYNLTEVINMETDVVAGRLKVMKYTMWGVIIASIIPYKHIPWASYVVSAIFSLYAATIMYCLLTWLVARIVKADKIAVSIGFSPHLLLYNFKSINILWGTFPVPDVTMPESVVVKHFKSWSISSIPPILMIIIGYAFVYYRNYLFETSPEVLMALFKFPAYSFAAVVAISFFFISYYAIMDYLQKWKTIYPQLAFIYVLFQSALTVGSFMYAYKNGTEIMKFIGL